MSKQKEIVQILTEKPGYLKWGADRLAKTFNTTKKKIKKAIKEIKKETLITEVSNLKIESLVKSEFNKDNVLIISDIHAPFTRKGFLKFCKDTQIKYNCGTIVFIGDIIDNHFTSYHEIIPDGKSAGDELDLAIEMLKPWYESFPEAKVCIGNHDALVFRKAVTAGIPKRWIKGFSEVLGTTNWDWQMEHEIHGVVYVHGTGSSGDKAAFNRAMNLRKPVVQGHLHTVAGVQFNASAKDLIWGLQVGCGIDDTTYAMEYAKHNIKKSIIGCGVVLDKGTIPMFIPMNL